jgi:hypothetical protein
VTPLLTYLLRRLARLLYGNRSERWHE